MRRGILEGTAQKRVPLRDARRRKRKKKKSSILASGKISGTQKKMGWKKRGGKKKRNEGAITRKLGARPSLPPKDPPDQRRQKGRGTEKLKRRTQK